MPNFYSLDDKFNTWSFLELTDDDLRSFIYTNRFSVNGYWAEDNPVLHFLLANELYFDFERFLKIMPENVNPNLCDGKTYGSKSLLIMLILMPPAESLLQKFIELYKTKLIFNYQDALGRTALHYVFILGRSDVVVQLLENGASLEIKDKQGKTPLEYLNCSEETICKTLKMIDIDPDRDTLAKENDLHDHYGRNLMLQGTTITQKKTIIDRILTQKPLLTKYIEGSPPDWGTFIGDNTSATYERLEKLANDIAKTYNTPIEKILVMQKLEDKEQEKFKAKLKDLSKNLSGTSIFEQCISGHSILNELLKTTPQYKS